MSDIVRFGVSLPRDLVETFDKHIDLKGYASRSEAIRDIMRAYLVEQKWETGEGQVMGTVTIVYDHHTRELSRVLSDIQHHNHDAIVCTTHVHLDEHNCLEVIVIRGMAKQVQHIANSLISIRGVIHGKLVCTTGGTL
ncbi:MAG: nickel-responsive transcriptional regulator NikR [bacterium]|jgi:CopG family nickel-responsive transcriptional regulator|nr:nickel-responsive transcriptional regulator NikR [bacterium]MDD4558221.1 nickel-responsive transcriptional regulator NikR [bacterium]